MKQCTYCGREYPDEAIACSLDQQPLESTEPTAPLPDVPELPPDRRWLTQIVLPAVLWFVMNLMLVGLFGLGFCWLFALLVALGAAIDCSKIQLRGSRVLGIAFKPIVVYATVAFFFCGFGFIWYLVLRYQVQTAPADLESDSEKLPPENTSANISPQVT